MKFEKIAPGMVLYDVHSERMGNTMMRSLGCWIVGVVSVDAQTKTAVVRWNGNSPRVWGQRQLAKLRAKRPEFDVGPMGRRTIKRKPKAAPAEREKTARTGR